MKWLLRTGAISQEDKDLYEYAAYSLLFSLVPLVIVIGFSILMGMLPQGITFVVPFLLLRKFSGGYHLESPGICFCVSVIVVLAFLLAIQYITRVNAYLYCIPTVILAALQLMVFSPIDSEARKLSEKEARVFKKIARAMTVASICVFAIAACVEQYWISIGVGAGVFLAACLQWPCIAGKYFKKA